MKSLKDLMFICLGCVAMSVFAAPKVDKVLVRQQWPWNDKVEIEYVISGVEGKVDVACQVYNGEAEIEVPANAFTGARFGLSDGLYRMYFHPARAFGDKEVPKKLEFRLSLTSYDAQGKYAEVIYKIYSLQDGSRTDITRGELLNGKWGAVESDFGEIGEGYKTELADVCIWTGVTNNPKYKTTHIVMRKIDKGKLKLSKDVIAEDAEPNVNITKDYWISVFEVTQSQFEHIYISKTTALGWKGNTGEKQTYEYGNVWTNSLAPVHAINSYMLVGGGEKSLPFTNVNWSSTSGFFPKLYKRTGCHFYLPTTAQWHKAARAGTRTWYYDGIEISKPSSFAKVSNADVLGRYKGNGGVTYNDDGSAVTNGTVEVGLYRPNAYGLYDMFGNASEVMMDSSYDTNNWPTTLTDDYSVGQGGYNIGVLGGQYNSEGRIPYNTTGQIHAASNRNIGAGLRLWLSDEEASLQNVQ
jgi:formylglycine-generating enzyme required for sulfatase activity